MPIQVLLAMLALVGQAVKALQDRKKMGKVLDKMSFVVEELYGYRMRVAFDNVWQYGMQARDAVQDAQQALAAATVLDSEYREEDGGRVKHYGLKSSGALRALQEVEMKWRKIQDKYWEEFLVAAANELPPDVSAALTAALPHLAPVVLYLTGETKEEAKVS